MLIWSFAKNIDIDEIVSLQDSLHAKKRRGDTNQFLIMAEHKEVFSYNKPSDLTQLRISHEEFKEIKIPIKHFKRGGSISYHGPGQLTCYFTLSCPEVDLCNHHDFRKLLEKTNKKIFIRFGVKTYTFEEIKKVGTTDGNLYEQLEKIGICSDEKETAAQGIWVITKENQIKKIACYGINFIIPKKIVTFGCALNIYTDLYYFNDIIKPCGLDIQITSIEQETNHSPDIRDVGENFVIDFINTLYQMHEKLLEKKYINIQEFMSYGNCEKYKGAFQ